MEFLKNAIRRIRGLLHGQAIEQDMDREMRLHLDLLAEYQKDGMSAPEATQAARRRFGNAGLLLDRGRDVRGAGVLGDIVQDLRYAGRTFFRTPVFTAVAVLSLALGIGANTAVFSAADAVLFRLLPVEDPQRLVGLYWNANFDGLPPINAGGSNRDPQTGLFRGRTFSSLSFERFRKLSENTADVFAFSPAGQLGVTGEGVPEVVSGYFVSGNYFSGLGVSAAAGRLIREEDDRAGIDPVAVISYAYWERRYGKDPGVLGKTVLLNKVPFTVVGVAPQTLAGGLMLFGGFPDFSIPLKVEPRLTRGPSRMSQPWNAWLMVMARLHSGVLPQQIQNSLEQVFQRDSLDAWNAAPSELRGNPDGRSSPKLVVAGAAHGYDDIWTTPDALGEVIEPIGVLLVVAGIVLLIVCINIANLLLARSGSRSREVAVRLALGASRTRLVRQMLTESIALALCGGTLGLALGYWGKNALQLYAAENGVGIVDFRLDLRVLAFSALVSLGTGVLFRIGPRYAGNPWRLDSCGESLFG